MDIKITLKTQLRAIEDRLDHVDNFTEWAILQNAKATVLAALQKYED